MQGPDRHAILLVDDDPVVLGLLASVLRAAGYEVLQASNGEDALELLVNDPLPVRLLITDVIMPRIGGNELASRLQAMYPGLPTVFCSGHLQEEVLHRGPGQGRLLFLHKPFKPKELLEIVHKALAG